MVLRVLNLNSSHGIFFSATIILVLVCVFGYEEIIRPEGMAEYIEMRNQCNWINAQQTSKHKCPGEAVECFLDVKLPEGNGYLHVIRFGPFTTTGGMQAYKCEDPAHVPPVGSYAIRSVIGPLDPHTESFLEYPPIHLHHAMVRPMTVDLPPDVPSDVTWQLPFLSLEEFQTQVSVFSANGIHCKSHEGGSNCYHVQTPYGYGQRKYDPNSLNLYTFFNQDVRAPDSPPISTVMEFGEIFITEPHKPIKATSDAALTVGSRDPPYTFELPYGKPSFIFSTYYFSISVQFRGNRMHFHPMDGDEVWVIRGTQEDLGIPEQLRTPPAYRSRTAGPVDSAHELSDGMSLEEFKRQLEANLDAAAEAFERTHGGSVNREAMARPLKDGYFLPYDAKKPATTSPIKPELLCKYYGETENLSSETIQAKSHLLRTRLEELELERSREQHHRETLERAPAVTIATATDIATASSATSSATTGPPLEAKPTNHKPPGLKLNSPEEQLRNIYAGTYPGEYYRVFSNSKLRGEERYEQCAGFDVLPGEFITIIHLNVPRVQPAEGQYDFTQLTTMQHMILSSQVHMPDAPFFNR